MAEAGCFTDRYSVPVPREGYRVLRRRSIRTKLIIALTLLSMVVLLLSISTFSGLHRFRGLADAVSNHSIEVKHANELYRHALGMKDSIKRTRQIRETEGMIDSSSMVDPLIDIEKYENSQFETAILGFHVSLYRYEQVVSLRSDPESTLVDRDAQLDSLTKIRSTYDQFDYVCREPHPNETSRKCELSELIEVLVGQTEAHVTMIHGSMATFSHDIRGQYRNWIAMTWFYTVSSIIIVIVLIAMFRSLVVKPFRTLLDGSRLVAGGQFNHRIDLGTGDELSELAIAMNDMTERFQEALAKLKLWNADLDRQVRDRSREVVQNEQLASVGFLAAGVAHEINNPLATIAWSAESLQSRVGELTMCTSDSRVVDDELYGALTTNLRRIEEEAYRCKGITEKLLDFSRLNEVRRAPTDLTEIVRDVVEMVGTVGKFRCKAIRVHADGSVTAEVNPQEIRQVVLNLVTNALESVDHDGAVDVTVGGDDDWATIIVQDNGCGMTEDVMQHLFEPFFTRRRDGTGTGLGLSITYRIISQHGGMLTPFSEGEGRGSRMELTLPIQPGETHITGSHRIAIANLERQPQAA
jgi:two-component system, NtrC family, sensor kinase